MIATLLAVASINSGITALVSPRYSKPQQNAGTNQLYKRIIYSRSSPSFNRDHQQLQRKLCNSALCASSTVQINGDIAISPENEVNNESRVNAFQPRTMKVSESMVFFSRFVVQSIAEKRAQKILGGNNRRKLRNRLKKLFFLRSKQRPQTATAQIADERIDAKKKTPLKKTLKLEVEEKVGKREGFRRLNESRKSLIRLVGYDSSLLVPAFGYLILGAFMSSIIPHYYSACISCVAAGEPDKKLLLRALMGLGVSHVFEALFTGFRGALFWIAGTFCVSSFKRFHACVSIAKYVISPLTIYV